MRDFVWYNIHNEKNYYETTFSGDGRNAIPLFVGYSLEGIMPTLRPDRIGPQRVAFEKARRVILNTQTRCGICGGEVDFKYKSPHPLSPTVDHIIPISKGGHPSDLANLQLAHRWCNRQKSDKLIDRNKFKANDSEIKNDDLPQHFDWANFKA